MPDPYLAHFKKENNSEDFTIQPISAHLKNTASLTGQICPLPELNSIAWLTAILHDSGKYRPAVQEYFSRIMREESVRRGEANHSSAGGWLIDQLTSHPILSQMIQVAIYSHHGLCDCISHKDGKLLIEERLKQEENHRDVPERFYAWTDKEQVLKTCREAERDFKGLLDGMVQFEQNQKSKNQYGNKQFFLGMYERILMSLLIDADWVDTASFMQGNENLYHIRSQEELQTIWQTSQENLENYLKKLKKESRLDGYRSEISDACREAGERESRLYRLTVPTGAGKTLSSLRFALAQAVKYKKRHIIYVAPFNSILEQNTDEIRNALGDPELVLEYHSNVLCETKEEREQYELLAENFASPVIATSAVQFLNTCFSANSGNVRRMHSLCNSVIIFDEIQALPVRIMKLFNLAVNFLTTFCNSTVVLCSATQPLLDRLSENSLLPPKDMAEVSADCQSAFRRTTIIDRTKGGTMWESIDTLKDFILEILPKERQVLVIVNTKSCAEKVYESLRQGSEEQEYELFHLSTNMCPENRKDALKEIRDALDGEKTMICVTTQLIEAGVNLSFRSVIRSLAGLDNLIQAAGRCNRHGKWENGNVYLVRMSEGAEDLSRLPDIRKAQEAMEEVLFLYAKNPGALNDSLDSNKAIRYYYQHFMKNRETEMEYQINMDGLQDTLLNLLSGNQEVWNSFREKNRGKHAYLRQAFRTAGTIFQVIPEDGKIDVVVEYNEDAKKQIDILQNPYSTISEKQEALRKVQRYTVGISEQTRRKLENAITPICDNLVLVLSENYYNHKTGVSLTPAGMEFLNM
ncbi:MAG: CRISPR-associated helicase Cas3' [Lachnospiraceae bacterium]|jgi:CRISPR-associated endonuclease/helicase Cas3|nr:CRISPR-associated helicase Cas3' [Lachnospiraceae bacterium]